VDAHAPRAGRLSRPRPAGSKEYLLEFVVQGSYVRCCAIDPVTGVEAVAVGAASASKEELSRLAIRKLEYVLAKKLGGPPSGGGTLA
jgi:hypothetical protein